MFEEAFFIMKPSKNGVRREDDIIREAHRILENSTVRSSKVQHHTKNNKNSKAMLFSFLFGFMFAVATCAVITVFVNII